LKGNYSIALDAGSNVLCSFSGSSASITPGTFAAETCSFLSGSVITPGNLTIALSIGSGQVDFDNVGLPKSAAEPSSLLLLGVGGIAVLALSLKRGA
jgi:PEP-CTERM motif